MIRTGLLGAGRIGQVHARNMTLPGKSELVAVADVNRQAAEALAVASGVAVMEVDALVADPAIDAVLIATSTDTHSPLIEAAVDAGKAVLCEKPVDLSLARAKQTLRHVDERGRSVMIGFNRRFDPNFAALKARFDQGDIGKGELLSITSFDPAPPPIEYVTVSGGLFRDMMIHDIDLACWIMGGAPESVMAVGSSLVDPAIGEAGDIDTAVATLSWSDGRMAVIRNSRRAAYGYDQRIELLGAEGLLQVDNVLENTLRAYSGKQVASAKPLYFFLERYMPAYVAEWQAFVDAIEQDRPMPTTLEEGVLALAVAEAATTSLARQAPVALAEFFP